MRESQANDQPTITTYETRLELFNQGDLFRDVPLAYPGAADQAVLSEEDVSAEARRFLSGPFDVGFGMLITPTCSIRAQGAVSYAHQVKTLVPVRPFEELVEACWTARRPGSRVSAMRSSTTCTSPPTTNSSKLVWFASGMKLDAKHSIRQWTELTATSTVAGRPNSTGTR